MAVSEAQKKAKKKYEGKNKEKTRVNSYKRTARSYIKNHAGAIDIIELRALLDEREITLKNNENLLKTNL